MATKISPWTDSLYSTSPDGQFIATIDDAWEVGMGAPTSGILKLSNGMTFQRCNPSAVWSDDSKFLAVPEWTKERMQRLLVISMEQASVGYAPDIFRVLELHSFSRGKIKGIDSPIHKPREIEIDLSEVQWK
ncbi:MAG TPA: hypothetical protein VF571_07850 [Pyrinomonadaceae bacterium]|jgi:hypothetical protein